jgi:predicted ATPase/class 3 adenylate cyclase
VNDLPTGTVTLLFSDIEGSTALLRRLGEQYAAVLDTQKRIMRAAFVGNAGRELGTEGDSFFVAFPTARDGVEAARTAQVELAREPWPDDVEVRVRMGLHTGEPTAHEDGYVGMDVHRAARMAASAHGGQVVVSSSTQRITSADPPAGIGFVDLGHHRLKDIPEPEHLYQLTAEGLSTDFPPLKTIGAASTLPVTATTIVGRDGELDKLCGLLRRPEVRLVTLTGPGGSGKTRLSIALAARLEPFMPDGVYFVSLGDTTTAEVMWSDIAEVLSATGEQRVQDNVIASLSNKQCLLILDNLEQLDDAPTVVGRLLSAGPDVSVLTTTRRLLHVTGEYEHEVPPLEVPAARTNAVVEAEGFGAIAMFVQRAAMVRSGFALSEANVADVVEICRRLDGLPLALELAASRLKLMSPASLLARLDSILELSGRLIDRPARQQTLRSTIEWSYSLLTPPLQVAFRQLGVFSGPFDLPAVEAVVVREGDATEDPLDLVADLVDASLVRMAEETDSEPRFRVLQTISAFAREKLVDNRELDDASRRHAEHFLEFLHEQPQQRDAAAHLAKPRIEAELGNLRAALTWSLGDPGEKAPPPPPGPTAEEKALAAERTRIGLGLCQGLSWFWYVFGYQAEGRVWLSRAVDAAADVGAEHNDGLIHAMHMLGVLLQNHGEWDSSRAALELCLEHWQEQGNDSLIAREQNSLGVGYRSVGEYEVARTYFDESIKRARASGDESRVATALSNLGILEVDEGGPEKAIVLLNEALEIDLRVGDVWGAVHDHCNLAAAMMQAGRVEEAWTLLRAHSASVLELGDTELTITVIELFCLCLAELDDPIRSARLLGAAEELRRRAELPILLPDAALLEASVKKVRDHPDPETWAANRELGRGYTADDAIAEGVSAH